MNFGHIQITYTLIITKNIYLRLPQFFAEYTIAPNDKITYIKETYFKNEMKFGKSEKTEFSKFNVEYFYNTDGILTKVIFDENEININIGKYGELIEKQSVYEINSNGISKSIYYDKEGKLISRCQINYNNLWQIISYDIYDGNSKYRNKDKRI